MNNVFEFKRKEEKLSDDAEIWEMGTSYLLKYPDLIEYFDVVPKEAGQ